jgi:hypothetical protein
MKLLNQKQIYELSSDEALKQLETCNQFLEFHPMEYRHPTRTGSMCVADARLYLTRIRAIVMITDLEIHLGKRKPLRMDDTFSLQELL